jgi:hypothetical protein
MTEQNNYILNEFKILKKLNETFLRELKFFYVFKNFIEESNVFIVTNEDKVFCLGSNNYGVLGFGHQKVVENITINHELSNKQIIDFKNGFQHVIALTTDGKIYCWGCNDNGILGNGREDDTIYIPKLNEYLSIEEIVEICCGGHHNLVLTKSGELYGWGHNDCGQVGNGTIYNQLIPKKVNGFNNEKVVMISCGWRHSMALTESGRVFSWGLVSAGQLSDLNSTELNKPSIVLMTNQISIKKISCGSRHDLMLSRDGDIYLFGSSVHEQTIKNFDDEEHLISAKSFASKINNSIKFIDIASHYNYDIFVSLSKNGIFYIWGTFGKQIVDSPKKTEFSSVDEIFAVYHSITYKTFLRQIILDENFYLNSCINNGEYKKDFRELEVISTGHYGVVCKAIYKKQNRIFAIKKIALTENEINSDLISKELNLMMKSNSVFVVLYFKAWVEENYYAENGFENYKNSGIDLSHVVFDAKKPFLLHIQMELCYKTLKRINDQLNEVLNRKYNGILSPLGYYINSEIFKEICESVNFLHKQNPPIIHRDLKPENILLTNGLHGRFIKIADFGLATYHEFEGQSHTKYKGAMSYMAPEVMKRKYYDTKADIYSLGIIYEDLFNIQFKE